MKASPQFDKELNLVRIKSSNLGGIHIEFFCLSAPPVTLQGHAPNFWCKIFLMALIQFCQGNTILRMSLNQLLEYLAVRYPENNRKV